MQKDLKNLLLVSLSIYKRHTEIFTNNPDDCCFLTNKTQYRQRITTYGIIFIGVTT